MISAWPGEAGPGTAGHGEATHPGGRASHHIFGMARRGEAWRGAAGPGKAPTTGRTKAANF